jgi:hypothetical protein
MGGNGILTVFDCSFTPSPEADQEGMQNFARMALNAVERVWKLLA